MMSLGRLPPVLRLLGSSRRLTEGPRNTDGGRGGMASLTARSRVGCRVDDRADRISRVAIVSRMAIIWRAQSRTSSKTSTSGATHSAASPLTLRSLRLDGDRVPGTVSLFDARRVLVVLSPADVSSRSRIVSSKKGTETLST